MARVKPVVRHWDLESVAIYIASLGPDLTALSDRRLSDTTRCLALLDTGCRCADASKLAWASPIQREPSVASLTDALKVTLNASLTKDELLRKGRGGYWSGPVVAQTCRNSSERAKLLWLGRWLDEYLQRVTAAAAKVKIELTPYQHHGRSVVW